MSQISTQPHVTREDEHPETVTADGEGAEVIAFPGQASAPDGEASTTTVTEVPTDPASDETPVQGEIVEQEGRAVSPALVDGQVEGTAGGWMADRRAFLETAPAVIPSYLKHRDEFFDNARFVRNYYAHVMAFHATRSPLYMLRLMGRSPRGAGRLVGKWLRWLNDIEAKPVLAKAAASGDPSAWMQLTTAQTKRTRTRRNQSLVVATPCALALVAAVVVLPGWAVGMGLLGLLSALGLAGGHPDKPIVQRYVSVHLQRELDSEEVAQALEAVGVKGKVHFVEPIQTDGPGWRAEIDLPPGYLSDKVLEKRSELAGAMRRPLATVWPETDPEAHPGRLVLWVAKQDPSKAKRRIWPLMKSGQANLFENVPFGFDPRGRRVDINLMYTNLLVGGLPGSGKTSATMVIALSAALDPRAELWVHELKGSGDLDSVRGVCHRYVSGDDDEDCEAAVGALRALLKELKRRKKVVADLPLADVPDGRKVSADLAARASLGLHPLVAIFDEAHTLFEHPEYGQEAADLAGQLIKKARAYGVILVFTTQKPDAKSLPTVVSDNVSTRFALALVGQQPNDMVLGTSAYKRGVRATMFDPKKDAGTGWFSRSAHDNQIVRAAFIKQEEAVAIGQRAYALRKAAGTLSGQAAGEEVAEVDTSTIIDHLHAVWPDGEESMHSHVLVDALAAYRPDLYASWVATDKPMEEMTEEEAKEVRTARSTTLSNALRPFRVKTRQINKRGHGGGGKGVRLDDLPEPGATSAVE